MTELIADELTEFGERLADESWAMLHAVTGERPEFDIKADSSVVTETDRGIEARLRERIEQTYPGHGILGEEHGSRGLDAEFVWVLDPIDGTNAFVAGLPIYGSLISVARSVADQIIFVDAGEIVEMGPLETFFDNPKSGQTRLFFGQIIQH